MSDAAPEVLAQLRRDARRILQAALHAVDPAPLVHDAVLNAPELRAAQRVHILAAGKAAVPMASAATEALGGRVTRALVVTNDASHTVAGDVSVMHASHPLPDERSVSAGRAALQLVHDAPADDVILALISGGASAMLALPAGDITLDMYRTIAQRLTHAGASIHELNCVRRRIDDIKGGRLAAAAHAGILVLLVSDVVGDAVTDIASGPFASDPTTADDVLHVLRTYDLLQSIPDTVFDCVMRSPPRIEAVVRHQVVADNRRALHAAAAYARRLGYPTAVVPEPLTGLAVGVGSRLARWLLDATGDAGCIIAGGESTVRVTGTGSGGRNQEVAVSAALMLDAARPGVVLSAGTDGIDGVTTAAGGIVDSTTVHRMRAAGVDPLRALAQNDTHPALAAVDDLVITGPTGTNVMDIHIALHRNPDA